VTQRELDKAVREVLGAKYDMGLFKDPYVRIGKAETDRPTTTPTTACTAPPPVTWHAAAWCCWRTANRPCR
jgi:beta-glucosidase-like glycosyl hydrolase